MRSKLYRTKAWKSLKRSVCFQILKNIKSSLALARMRSKWIKKSGSNNTLPMRIFNPELVSVGESSYGELNIISFSDKSKLYIKDYVSIGQDVTFLLDAEHPINHISTFPYKVRYLYSEEAEATSKGDIIIEDDVWIGYGATILSGVHIGQGAVVAARAVVSKDVPPYAVVGGVPAKVIKYRFSQQVIDYMLTLDYGSLTNELINDHVDDLYTPFDGMDVEEIKKQYEWFPKKK